MVPHVRREATAARAVFDDMQDTPVILLRHVRRWPDLNHLGGAAVSAAAVASAPLPRRPDGHTAARGYIRAVLRDARGAPH
jgi:hypothetical protein